MSLELLDQVDPKIPEFLPHDMVYSIQVGYKLFQVSGASLLSDAPSYFTRFFDQPGNAGKTLFIDRSPLVFKKVYMHLQGYHISVDTDYEFVHLWQDAYYFCLTRLQKLLRDEPLIARVGDTLFKIPRVFLYGPGNHPNFFLIGMEGLSTKSTILNSDVSLIRPPPQRPTLTINRSPILFADLLEIFRGNYEILRNDEHRTNLIKECRYYRFLQLEQAIIKHKIIRNPFTQKEDIILNLVNLNKAGIINLSTSLEDEQPISYIRPYLRKEPRRHLIIQIDSDVDFDAKLIIPKTGDLSFLVLTNRFATKMSQVFELLAKTFSNDGGKTKLVLPCNLLDAAVTVNGIELKKSWFREFFGPLEEVPEDEPPHKRKRCDTGMKGEVVDFKLKQSLWRITSRTDKLLLQAVSINAVSDQFNFNKSVEFL
ncbi:hypothetical protein METBIDRAFT_13807 [Metschnikowia bicuspidata var. bicuspidata NRRL YB-4993]|uniref:Potassium channel tetramerisation-type BTB domain-containing protein n=1 Tax=Metschnikowia bicuspidata var. bicuspidata NRRL YB-4993 TaxID=869754 RepID=A0A1A0H572_9ASCO|nr:hypothetical protein METBIDRAFT_13807 [Metschnikowia bicuspidata var. bicuspidata NRRL YB-4993]OBA19057.1 hypothetical protein METBIDRAFT_13807 [Metschnikowia bicuspidata var. bicuspidata NRRL YB-4993]